MDESRNRYESRLRDSPFLTKYESYAVMVIMLWYCHQALAWLRCNFVRNSRRQETSDR